MGRDIGFARGKIVPALVAGFIGYLIGGWHPVALRAKTDFSAAQSIASRFPQAWIAAPAEAIPANNTLPAAGVLEGAAAPSGSGTSVQIALLDPEPMVPQPASRQPPQALQNSAPQPAAEENSEQSLAPAADEAPAALSHVAPPPARVARAPAAEIRRRPPSRPGYMLDDAQIASIRERLHLTPDQERMWPAVEAALRNIAYRRAQEARHGKRLHGEAEMADVDPESVQGLKSAAVPLIMSFNDEQKQEVRNLAHVMGLDQLAAQF